MDGAWAYELPSENSSVPQLTGTFTNGCNGKVSTGYDPAGPSAPDGGAYREVHGVDAPTNNHYVMVVNRVAGRGWGGGAVKTHCA